MTFIVDSLQITGTYKLEKRLKGKLAWLKLRASSSLMYIETLLRPVALAGTLRFAPLGSTGQSDGIARNTCMDACMLAAVHLWACLQARLQAEQSGEWSGADCASMMPWKVLRPSTMWPAQMRRPIR